MQANDDPVHTLSQARVRSETTGSVANTTLVSVRQTQAGGAVLSSLIGLSYEKLKVAANTFTPTNGSLIACFRQLGTSLLRIGGNSVDKTSWNAVGSGGVSGQVAPSDIASLAAFLKATGWRVIYGINFATNTPAEAAAEAAYAAQALGSSLHSFEIGNEPDGYASNGLRPSTYVVSDFIPEWASFASAIRQAVPNAPISGPAAGYQITDWTLPFAASEAMQINLLTEHYYRGDGRSATSTIPVLLSPDQYLSGLLSKLRTGALSAGVSGGYRLTEANSFYNGGADGVSNTHASALWAVDFALTNAQAGSAGVNFHGGGDGSYNPFYTPLADDDGVVVAVRPEYYGLLFVSQIAPGQMYDTSVTSDLNVSAYAVAGNDGATYVVVINKDGSNVTPATILLEGSGTMASMMMLTGPALDATTGTTLGGAAMTDAGEWAPTPSTILPVTNSTIAVNVPPASAILLRISNAIQARSCPPGRRCLPTSSINPAAP